MMVLGASVNYPLPNPPRKGEGVTLGLWQNTACIHQPGTSPLAGEVGRGVCVGTTGYWR